MIEAVTDPMAMQQPTAPQEFDRGATEAAEVTAAAGLAPQIRVSKRGKSRRASAPAGPPTLPAVVPAEPETKVLQTASTESSPQSETAVEPAQEQPTLEEPLQETGSEEDTPASETPVESYQFDDFGLAPALEPASPPLANVEAEPAFLAAPGPVEEPSLATEPKPALVPVTEPKLEPESTPAAEPIEQAPSEQAPFEDAPFEDAPAEQAPSRQALRAQEAAKKEEGSRSAARALAKDAKGSEHRIGRKIWRWTRRALLLALLAVLLVALGSTVATNVPAGPTATEQARSQALNSSQQLLSESQLLLTASPKAALLPALKNAESTLSAAVKSLSLTTATVTASTTPQSTSQGTQKPTVAEFVAGLDAAAQSNLSTSASVDPGLARLLASVGSGQVIASQYLAQLSGLKHSAVSAPTVTAPPSSSCSTSSSSSAGTASSASQQAPASQDALNAVALAEQKAIYAYQVAATRMETQQATDSTLKLLASHQASLSAAQNQFQALCLQAPAQQPGFPLSAAFLTSPNTVLASLENQLSLVYGDLVGLSDGSLRQWAIAQLLASGRNALLYSAPQQPLPGLKL
ncbi:hypothetical protein FHU41_002952 [Psychromicrobium silvestre]|uniref:DUF4439 domain-containing protein n=1 Tax=Psychromicrobium silvestre TaxID=1645614 RepID=A0A7Y9LW39_9MICC|nr:DUF4439 domain-containing protein [Psychromicrobium silvestre]NYE96702.1 hypothetical protein [Psychromicrobium silvestre]